MNNTAAEHWLRGPVNNINAFLQPVAHALLQAKDEVNLSMLNFPDHLLWKKPAGMASTAFHLQHMKGVLDRLFTYANNEQLNQEQLTYLSGEGKENTSFTVSLLLKNFNEQVDVSLEKLSGFRDQVLLEKREVGRKKLPSNVIGLLFHAAEHVQRHNGQLIVTVNVVKAGL